MYPQHLQVSATVCPPWFPFHSGSTAVCNLALPEEDLQGKGPSWCNCDFYYKWRKKKSSGNWQESRVSDKWKRSVRKKSNSRVLLKRFGQLAKPNNFREKFYCVSEWSGWDILIKLNGFLLYVVYASKLYFCNGFSRGYDIIKEGQGILTGLCWLKKNKSKKQVDIQLNEEAV